MIHEYSKEEWQARLIYLAGEALYLTDNIRFADPMAATYEAMMNNFDWPDYMGFLYHEAGDTLWETINEAARKVIYQKLLTIVKEE